MLQLAGILIGLAGVIQLYNVFVNKKQVLRPVIVEKLGDRNARIIGIILSVILIAVTVYVVVAFR